MNEDTFTQNCRKTYQVTVHTPTNASTSYIGRSLEKAQAAYLECCLACLGRRYRTVYLIEGDNDFVVARTSFDQDGKPSEAL